MGKCQISASSLSVRSRFGSEAHIVGREIRRVPPHWGHPKYDASDRRDRAGEDRPCYDETFAEAAAEWERSFSAWESGGREESGQDCEFWEWEGGPPDPEMYRPKFTEEPTWFQVYETVSEGTPVSPPFATKEELIEYLVEYGDFWCQQRRENPPSREAATAFVESEWAPSMMVMRSAEGTSIKVGIAATAPDET